MSLAYAVLDWLRSFRTWQLREERREKEGASSGATKGKEAVWWQTAVVDTAYTSSAMHWASEKGMLSDGWVGALISFIGLTKLRAAWAQTA